MNKEITFISNNVKGIQNSVKRRKLLEYFTNCVMFKKEINSKTDSN